MSLVSMALLSASESVKSVMGSTSTAAGRNSRIVLCMKARCVSRPYTAGRADSSRNRPCSSPAAQIHADRVHVARELLRRLLEREEQAALSALAGRLDEAGGHAGLAGPRRPRDEDGAAAEIAASQHGIQPRHAGGHALRGRRVLEPQGGDGQDGEAGVVDEEGVLVRAVGGAAVLDDPQPSRGDLTRDPVVEEDHAIRDVFLESLPGEGAGAALRRDDGRHVPGLQPAEEAAQLRAQQVRVGQAREQALDGVEHDALGADGVDGVAQANEQSFQVVLAGLLDLGALDAHEVDEELLLGR